MNIFGITSIIIFFSSIGFGLSLYSSNRESRVNKAWFIASIFIALWGLALSGVTSASTENTALAWQYLLDIVAIFIPVSYFAFASEIVRVKNHYWRHASYVLALCLALFSVTPHFKLGVQLKYDFYWILPGDLYIIFPIFFVTYTVISLYLFIRSYVKTSDALFKAQIRNALLAGVFGFGGGITNFLPQTFDVYPFGNYFVLLYVFFMTYGVLKYKLLSKKIISAQLFAGAMVLVFLFNLLQPTDYLDWIIRFMLFALVLFFSILLVRGVYREVEAREKIEQLAKELETANERLKELDQMKSEFLSIATHQMRAPITAIKGYASLILEDSFGKVEGDLRNSVDVIYQSAQGMSIMVDDFLNISRIEQGRMKYDFVVSDAAKLASQVVTELRPAIEKKGLELTIEFDPAKKYDTNMDIGKMKQAIINIIDNAMKYTPKGWIHVSVTKSDADKLILIEVKDSGVGISAENIPKLFSKFSRAKNGISTNVSGTGLGLYVVKQMVESQSGRVWVTSEGEGKGSTFHIELKAE